MSSHCAAFWQDTDRYHDLARSFERNVEVTHPDYVSGKLTGTPFRLRSKWMATNVTYYEHKP